MRRNKGNLNKEELLTLIKLQVNHASNLYIHKCKEENQKSQNRRRAWENGEAFEEENEDDTEDSYDSSFIDDSEDHPPSPKAKKTKKKKNNQRLYGYLKVDTKADDVLLRRQYKQLSREWHPDKNESAEAEEIMKNITLAYRILSDRVQRSLYGKRIIRQDIK